MLTYIYIYLCIIDGYLYVSVMYTCIYIYAYYIICIYIYAYYIVYIYMHVILCNVCMYVMYVCMYVRMYVCMHACMYVYIYG